jgi:hypothetical protein
MDALQADGLTVGYHPTAEAELKLTGHATTSADLRRLLTDDQDALDDLAHPLTIGPSHRPPVADVRLRGCQLQSWIQRRQDGTTLLELHLTFDSLEVL